MGVAVKSGAGVVAVVAGVGVGVGLTPAECRPQGPIC